MKGPIRENIAHQGQPYVDEPVRIYPKPAKPLATAVAAALGNDEKQPEPVTVAHNRVRLRWLHPNEEKK